MINAGKYNHRIKIVRVVKDYDKDGFPVEREETVLEPWASVRTTSGYTLVKSGTDFEEASTNFTIRYPVTAIDRDMRVRFNGKTYTIQYLNDVNEANVELEMQCREVTH